MRRLANNLDGRGAISRLLLAFLAMFATWLISCVCLALVRLTFEPMLEVKLLALWSGLIACGTYVVFAAPASALPAYKLQLRYPYILVLCALMWSALFVRFFFQEWPWAMLHEPLAAELFLPWIGGFTLCSVGIYLVLLRRTTRAE
jgi:hypothetical protein